MDFKYLVVGREATPEEMIALEQASIILDAAGLELVGGRPKGR